MGERGKPRVAFIIPGLGAVNRGAEAFVKELAKRLQNKYDITILSRGVTELSLSHRTIKVIPRDNTLTNHIYSLHPFWAKVFNGLFLDPLNIEMLTSAVASFGTVSDNFDLIFPVCGVWGAITARFVRAIRNVPFIHCGYAGLERAEYWVARQRPDMYVALTSVAQRWIQAKVPGINCTMVPNGVDAQRFAPTSRKENLSLDRPIYLCVAALVPLKRVELAIRAVSRLQKGSLLVLGDGPLRSGILHLGKQILGDGRFLLKSVPYSQMPRYYSSCDVFTLPSKVEGFGIAYLEAMASGKPVVAPKDEIREEIVGKSGILCNVQDIAEYANCLEVAARTNFGDVPRKRAEQFSWETVASKYDEVFRQVLEKRALHV